MINFASQVGDCSVLVTIVFDEVRTKVLCIHMTLIIICYCVCCGSKNSKNVLFSLIIIDII